MNKRIMAGVLVLLAWSGLCRGQFGLGGPVPTDNADDVKLRPYHPVLSLVTRNRQARALPLVPPVPPPEPTREDIAHMVNDGGFSPAEIAAAKIRLDEMQAKARQAAVKYLATVDCHYYPEAESSLVAALRADRSEAVRLEAAQALGNCKGVTVRILDALHLTATAQELDGNPAETSERVRAAARLSLNLLLSSGMSANHADSPLPPINSPAAPEHGQRSPLDQERAFAATIGAPASAVPPNPPPPARPTLLNFWLNLLHGQGASSAPTCADPRLRGMAPLAGEPPLAIPATRQTGGTMDP